MKKKLLYQILRENVLAASILLLAAVLCSSVWYATFRQSARLSQQQDIWNSKRRMAITRTENQGAGQYLHDKEQIRHLYNAIPYRHEFPRVISEIIDFIALHGATSGPMSYKPLKNSAIDGTIAYSMSCSASGNYPGLKRLLAELERLDGISTLDAVSFTTPDPALEKVTLDLQLTVYLREGRP